MFSWAYLWNPSELLESPVPVRVICTRDMSSKGWFSLANDLREVNVPVLRHDVFSHFFVFSFVYRHDCGMLQKCKTYYCREDGVIEMVDYSHEDILDIRKTLLYTCATSGVWCWLPGFVWHRALYVCFTFSICFQLVLLLLVLWSILYLDLPFLHSFFCRWVAGS